MTSKNKYTEEVTYQGEVYRVTGGYDEGEPQVSYYPDMSGHPGEAPGFTIYKLEVWDEDGFKEVTDITPANAQEKISEIVTDLITEKYYL